MAANRAGFLGKLGFSMSVYLDHAATTVMRDSAIQTAADVMGRITGNPSGAHGAAQQARTIIEEARDEIAELLGAAPRELVFTSGGTESANLGVIGAARVNDNLSDGSGVVCSAIEHHAVLNAVESLGGRFVRVKADGQLDMGHLAELIDGTTSVVSVMAVNNETGGIQDIGTVARTVANRAPQAVVHTDAVQAVAWLDVASHCKDAHLLSVSAHKIGGPMGTGALVVREGTKIAAQIVGGGQERELRSGTQNVAGIAAFCVALRETVAEREATVSRVRQLRDALLDGLAAACEGVRETVPRRSTVAGHAHVTFDDIDSESLLFMCDEAGLFASAGASCASGAMQPSHVLMALGLDERHARNGVRLTLGRTSTLNDVDEALRIIPSAVERLSSRRRVSA